MSPQLTAGAILGQTPLVDAVLRAAAGRPVYLVGGAVRDALLGRATPDFDYVVADAPQVAARLARMVRGVLVLLHEDWPTARVVSRVRGHRVELDLASPRARSLRADLEARDFTINALAAGPLGSHPRLVDPCGGREDLKRRLVRMTSPAALSADPVRVVRAYRFAAQLGFRVTAATHRACGRLAPRLSECAAERIGAELLKLCAGGAAARALAAMAEAQVLDVVFPELSAARGIEQGGAHEFDVLTHSLVAVQRLGALLGEARRLFGASASEVQAYLADPATRAIVTLAALLHDVGKPECRVWSDGRWRFFGHETRGAELADAAAKRLRLPRRLRRRLQLLVSSHMRLLAIMGGEEPTGRARRRLAHDLGDDLSGLVLLCLADRRALAHDWDAAAEKQVAERLAALLAAAGEVSRSPGRACPPITGDDLLGLGLRPGPLFREILEAVGDEWFAGTLTTKAEALGWVRSRWRPDDRAE